MTEAGLADRLLELVRRQAERRELLPWLSQLFDREAEIEVVNASTLRVRGGEGEKLEIRVHLVPPPPRANAVSPWKPRSLDLDVERLAHLSYVVVDEIVEDAVRLSVSRWPYVDERGRLHFSGSERALVVRASLRALAEFLAERAGWRAARGLRMGTVLAANVDYTVLPAAESDEEVREGAVLEPRHPAEWMTVPVYDVSADAREKAKEAFYAAVAPTLAPRGAVR